MGESIVKALKIFIFWLSVLGGTAFFSVGVAKASMINLRAASQPAELGKGQGYLLLHLNVGGVAPSMEFVKLTSKQELSLRSEKKRTKRFKSVKINLKDKEKGLYLLNLPQGLYQVTQINAPYFNLPYRMSTDNEPYWRFYVEPGKVNYFGQLTIAKERSTRHVNISRLNRIATDKSLIDQELAGLIKNAPLRVSVGVRDDYMEFFKGL